MAKIEIWLVNPLTDEQKALLERAIPRGHRYQSPNMQVGVSKIFTGRIGFSSIVRSLDPNTIREASLIQPGNGQDRDKIPLPIRDRTITMATQQCDIDKQQIVFDRKPHHVPNKKSINPDVSTNKRQYEYDLLISCLLCERMVALDDALRTVCDLLNTSGIQSQAGQTIKPYHLVDFRTDDTGSVNICLGRLNSVHHTLAGAIWELVHGVEKEDEEKASRAADKILDAVGDAITNPDIFNKIANLAVEDKPEDMNTM